MHRFYLPPEQCRSNILTLEDREAHHAVHVLRLARGARVVVLNGAGDELGCEVLEAHPHLVCLKVTQQRQVPTLPYEIILLQALPKGRVMEDIIEKATELGAHRIVPLLSERVVTRLTSRDLEIKTARWRQRAVEALKQCGNAWMPLLELPTTPQAFLERKEVCDLAVIGSLVDKPCHLAELVQVFFEQHQRLPRSVQIWIGPEGDFTPAEVELAKSGGARPVSLGRLVLRCETAAVYCLSVINHELSAPRVLGAGGRGGA